MEDQLRDAIAHADLADAAHRRMRQEVRYLEGGGVMVEREGITVGLRWLKCIARLQSDHQVEH